MQLDTTETVSIITVFGVIFNAALSAIISLSASRKTIYINSVTAERMKWINEIRETVSIFQASHTNIIFSGLRNPDYSASKEYQDAVEAALKSEMKLEMHLKGRGKIEDNVVELVSSFGRASIALRDEPGSDEKLAIMQAFMDQLSMHSNYLFKQEWERVKIEASGTIYAAYLRARARRRRKEYINFCNDDGYFVPNLGSKKYEFPRTKLFFRKVDD